MDLQRGLCPCLRNTPHSYGMQCKIVCTPQVRRCPTPIPGHGLLQDLKTIINKTSDDYTSFARINNILLNPSTPLKHIPLRIYIPSTLGFSSPNPSSKPFKPPLSTDEHPLGSIKIIQTLIPPHTDRREPQTLGSALNAILPSLFPSRRDAILAEPILHGAAVPFRAPLEEVMREAAYADGWLHLGILMIDA